MLLDINKNDSTVETFTVSELTCISLQIEEVLDVCTYEDTVQILTTLRLYTYKPEQSQHFTKELAMVFKKEV